MRAIRDTFLALCLAACLPSFALAQTLFASQYDAFNTTVASARSAGGTSLVVASVGSLPNPTAPNYYRLTIANASTRIPYAHLKVTGVNLGSNTLTIAGPLDGTTDPTTIPVGDVAYISVNSGTVNDMQAAINARLIAANNLSDLASASVARTNLGLGTAATLASTAVLQASNNLADLSSAGTARTNLGLGTAAVKAASGAGGTVASVSGVTVAGHLATFADTAGTVQDGGPAPTGTVSSVALAVPSGLSVSGSPVTGSGTLTISTSLSGMLKGTGSGLAAATPGTDFLAPTGNGSALTGITSGQVSGLAASATTDTTNAANISSGTLPGGRMPALAGDVTSSAGTTATTVSRINGTSLAGLTTGLLKNTTGTGVPSIATAGVDYLAPSGNGSALTNLTAAQVGALMDVSPTAEKTSAYTAAPGDLVKTNTTSGTVPITLTNAPADRSVIIVKMTTQGGTNTTTIATQGVDVFNYPGTSTTLTLTGLRQSVALRYSLANHTYDVFSTDPGAPPIAANLVQAGPTSGGAAASTYRSLVAADMPAFTGDATTPAGTTATTLATVNGNVGSFTSANITVNAKGLITAAANGTGGGGGFTTITPSISASQNNWAPTGLTTNTVIEVAATAYSTITGLSAQSAGAIALLCNSGSFPVKLSAADSNSTAANRFQFPQSVYLMPNETCLLVYNGVTSGWMVHGNSPGEGESALFGSGADGTVTISSGTTTLTRDIYYANLTISGTGQLATNGYRVFVAGILDISAAPANAIVFQTAAIMNGGNASGATAGTGTANVNNGSVNFGSNSGGPGGGAGGVNNGSVGNGGGSATGTPCSGGANGGSGGNGGTGTKGTSGSPGGNNSQYFPAVYFPGVMAVSNGGTFSPLGHGSFSGSGSGGGGDGTNSGGGGGAAGMPGGVLWIAARFINKGTNAVSTGVIVANGGNGGNGGNGVAGNAGGGGGGGAGQGGAIFLYYGGLIGSTITNCLTASGGTGGNGGALAGTGAIGVGGWGGTSGYIFTLNMRTGGPTHVLPASSNQSGYNPKSLSPGGGATTQTSSL